jgi:phosphoglycerol transferase MdoB-like AlkP superfamily enzyme
MLVIQHCGHMWEEVREAEGWGGDMLAMSALGWTLWAVVVVCVLLALAFWPARVAHRKGHSWFLFFIFSLFLFFPALITAYLVQDRNAATPAPL